MAAGPRHLRARRHRTWGQRLLIGSGVVFTVLCVVGASAVGYVYWKLGRLVHFDNLEVSAAPPDEPENYLIVGSDSRENIDPSDPDYEVFQGGSEAVGGKRSDTIMIVRVDPELGSMDLLSFPRDLFVEIAGTGSRNRINSAYGKGRQVLIDTIQQDFRIPVNHYIEVDFRGFRGLVNAIGGVPMYFDTPMRDTHSGLFVEEPGCVSLDGDQGLAFARSRNLQYRTSRGWQTDPTGDLGRITRQQIFIRRSIDKALSGGFPNPARLNRLLNVAVENVGVDKGLDVGDLLNLARQFQQFGGDDLRTHSLPVDNGRTSAGASVLYLRERDAQPVLNIFRGIDPGVVSPQDVAVRVLNGAGIDGLARDAKAALTAIGFISGETGNTPPRARTAIRYAPGSEAAADLLARHLTSGAELLPDTSLPPASLVLLAGSDFTTVMERPRAPAPTTTTTAGPGATTSTTVADTTTTTVIGRAPGEPPPGETC